MTARQPDSINELNQVAPILAEATKVLQRAHGPHLQTITIERLVVGVFFVGLKLSTGEGGVAYTPPEAVKNAGRRILRGGSPTVRGMQVSSILAGELVHPFSGVIRLATLNALSVPLFAHGCYSLDGGDDLSTMDTLFRGRRVCMVGAIIPLLRRLKDLQPAEVTIIDRKKETEEEAQAGYGTFVPPEQTAVALKNCQTAIFTGATVANGSISELLALTPSDTAIAVVGPSAGFVPDPLFARKVAMVGTSMITDIDRALDLLAEGGGGYRLFDGCVRKINLPNLLRLQQLGLVQAC
ncbi:DUF364 domain-containing protein [Desulfobulbus rhabdoformis]|uniref:DUF364 domain-containing protein n=1 Tax=Desulfobulbus rhabdoformis TaxID=34032 RepID=UPI00196683D4|nr:DUF364 domain-containing protein [Desulfobulbus rhabdoformis]MBM9615529.1 DUF364 domain-containing protein [Desulfobulbus rhabdoformis]